MSRFAQLNGFERLETRDQPAAGPLGNLNATGSPAFFPLGFGPPDTGATLGNKIYFLAADGTSNPALYSSDGTAGGTALVKSVTPASSAPAPSAGWEVFGANTSPVIAAAGKLFFTAPGSASGVWVSDGTAAGTTPVVVPGAANGTVAPLMVAGGRVLFTATVSGAGGYPTPQLVSTDGTPGGTVVLSNTGNFRSVTAAGGKVYFLTQEFTPGVAAGPTDTLWQTDGTAAGTKAFVTLPADMHVNDFSPNGPWLAAVGGKVYFAGNDATGTELWVSDGTAAGTKKLKEINPTTQGGFDPSTPYPRSSHPQQFTAVGSAVYFAADDGVHGQELWTTDGTTAGTQLVKDLSPTVGSPQFELTGTPSGSRVGELTAFGGKVYFSADDGTTGPQLYATNGTAAGTVKLTSAVHSANAGGGFLSNGETPAVVATLGNKLLFGLGDAARGRQLWATDGTAAGTAVVSVIGTQATAWDRAFAGPLPVGVVNGRVLFSADDGTRGRQLWSTDGTAAGTKQIARLNPTDLGSHPQGFVTVGPRVLFTATDGHGAYSLFATDGTAAPTLVKRFDAGADLMAFTQPGALVRSGGLAYFALNAGSYGKQLWATDGTPAGTKLVKEVTLPADLNPTGNNPLGLANLTDVNGKLFFTVDLPGVGQQLWKTDGSPAGTGLVKQVNANSSSPNGFAPPGTGPMRDLTANGGKLFFAADTDASSGQVWVSDGTAAGTKAVSAIPAGAFLSATKPDDLTVFKGKVYFTAGDGTNGRRLWATDGTTAGTVAVSPARPLDQPQYTVDYYGAANMVAAGGKLFTVKSDGQLWATDGTAGGEVQLTRFRFGFGPPADVKGLTAVGSKVFFAATDGTGRQLWVSDGTAAGTKVVKALGTPATPTNPYPAGANPAVVAVVGSQVLFAADDGIHGRELWVTDGTAAETKLAADLNPGAGSGITGNPAFGAGSRQTPTAALVNGRLVFAAYTSSTGVEPWAAPLADLGIATPPVVPPTPGGASVVAVFGVNTPAGVAFRGNLATVTLPDGPRYTANITWGDGSTSTGTLTRLTATGKAYTISGSHTYEAPGSRPVSIRVTANGQTVLTVQTTATVIDARFYVGRVAERVTAGRSFAGTVATTQDLNPANSKATDYTAVIDWGDGSKSAGSLRRTAAGRYEVVGTHTFTTTVKRTVSVTVTSKLTGKTATTASIFLVDPPRPVGDR